MTIRFILNIIICASLIFIYAVTLDAVELKEVKYYGYSGVVDLKDIYFPADQEITDETAKRISAEITRKYHERGYRAFYIERVLVKSDGVVEFYFNESAVSHVIVSGLPGNESDRIKGELLKKGEPYNEEILKKNITALKSNYGYSNIHVNVEREADGRILLRAEIVKRRKRLNFSVQGDAIYGTIPHVSWQGDYEWGNLIFGFYSSFNQRSADISGISLFIDFPLSVSTGVLTGFNSQWRSDYYDETGIFSDRSIFPEIALYSMSGLLGRAVVAKGEYYRLYDYPESEDGIEYSGFSGLRFFYNDRGYRIDRRDERNVNFEIIAGKNSLEDGLQIRIESDLLLPFRFSRRGELVLKNSFFLTSEKERLFQRYVFNYQLPGRSDDYLTSDFRNSSGVEIPLEIYPSLLYIGPLFYYGIFRVEGRGYESSRSAGLFISVAPQGISLNFAYVYDISWDMKDGVFLFSMSGAF